jgi:2-succinyl-6-hydroxy-2,4-cyclohexadiene-1-carboxylate synthase
MNPLAEQFAASTDLAPVLVLHGFAGSGSAMRNIVEPLQGRYATWAPDLPGHGKSPRELEADQFTMAGTVDAIAGSLVERGGAHLIGYSMGGRVALSVAVAHPELVSSVVTIGASPGLDNDAERAARRVSDAELADRIETDGIEWFERYWSNLALFDSQRQLSEATREQIRHQRLACRPAGLAMSLHGIGTGSMEPLHESLLDLEVPMCWISGRLDSKFGDIASAACAGNQAFDHFVIDNAGHAAHLEQPEAANSAIASFLARFSG